MEHGVLVLWPTKSGGIPSLPSFLLFVELDCLGRRMRKERGKAEWTSEGLNGKGTGQGRRLLLSS